jgi:hypothetical protein
LNSRIPLEFLVNFEYFTVTLGISGNFLSKLKKIQGILKSVIPTIISPL